MFIYFVLFLFKLNPNISGSMIEQPRWRDENIAIEKGREKWIILKTDVMVTKSEQSWHGLEQHVYCGPGFW